MPIIAIAVAAIGTAAGTAIGAAIGGSILGVSMATIGGVIGAGLAGGALAAATGGSFGKGFLMGAAGAAIGGFLKAGLGEAVGAGAEGMTEQASMLEAQGGAEFAPNALEGAGATVGDVASGMGDISGAAGAGIDMSTLSPEGIPITDSAGVGEFGGMSQVPPAADSFSLDQLGSYSSTPTDTGGLAGIGQGVDTGFTSGNMMVPDTGFASSDPYGFTASPEAAPTSAATGGGLENIGQGSVQPADGTTSSQMLQSQGGAEFAPSNAPQSGGLGGMFKTSDAWLKENLGMPSGSTGKLAMGGLQTLMDYRSANKLQKQAKGTAPMSFEQYQQEYMDPQAYRTAANQLARSGHTGALPTLLARMKQGARGDYTKYRTGAEQRNLENQAAISRMKSNSLQNLFAPYAMNLYQQGGK